MPGKKLPPWISALTEGQKTWRDMVNDPPEITPGELPPPPPQFRPEPFVSNSYLAQAVDKLLRIAPQLKGKVKSVVAGPTDASIRQMVASKLDPEEFAGTNLLGITDLAKGQEGHVGISPWVEASSRLKAVVPPGASLDETLAHELAHVAGYGEIGARMGGEHFVNNPTTPKITDRELLKLLMRDK